MEMKDTKLPTSAPRRGAPSQGSVLVVDDDPEIRRMLLLILTQNGFEADGAESPKDALGMVSRKDYGLILLDVNLPGMNGLEFFSVCKERLPYTEVIIITGDPEFDSAAEMVRKGAYDYLPKPFSAATILEKARAAFSLRSQIIASDLEHLAKSGSSPAKDFSFVRSLGSGSMGDVFLVERHGVRYAMKKYRPFHETARNPSRLRNKFLRVNAVLSKMKHPNVVRVFDYCYQADGESSYLIMEYVEGDILSNLTGRKDVPLERRMDIVRQLACGIASVHASGIIHRDIKPGNVLVTHGMEAKLSDFGIANMLDSALVGTEDFRGSPAYMAPETFNASGICSLYSDVYSLGVLAYELVTGRRPFSGKSMLETANMICKERPEDPSKFEPKLSESFKNVIASALHKSPSMRCDSETLADALAAILEGGAAAKRAAAGFDTPANKAVWKD